MSNPIDVSEYVSRLTNHGPAYSICIPAEDAKKIFDELLELRKLRDVAFDADMLYYRNVNDSTITEE